MWVRVSAAQPPPPPPDLNVAHGMGEEGGRLERECGRVVEGTGDCKINARVGRLAECGGRLVFRPSRACPATRPAPRTPDLNVGFKKGPERCKINARFCAGRTRFSLRSTLKSGGRGERLSVEIQRPARPPPLPMQRQKKRAFILQSPVQEFPERRFSLKLGPHSSHLLLQNRCPQLFPPPLEEKVEAPVCACCSATPCL